MHLSYNGVHLEFLKISDWLREYVYDPSGSDPIYLRHYIKGTFWLNPALTSMDNFPAFKDPNCPKVNPPWAAKGGVVVNNPVGQLVNIPPAANGNPSCVDTDAELVRRLSQPRMPLKVWLDSKLPPPNNADAAEQIMLQSPLPGFTCDAMGTGPQCKVLSVVPVMGQYSLCIEAEFETFVPVCANNQSPILSNRWTYVVSHDPETHRATHVISGQAAFRMDVLVKNQQGVDEFRKDLMLPVPDNFQRYPPQVTIWPNGAGCDYRILEIENFINLPGLQRYNATSISVVEKRAYSQPFSGGSGQIEFARGQIPGGETIDEILNKLNPGPLFGK